MVTDRELILDGLDKAAARQTAAHIYRDGNFPGVVLKFVFTDLDAPIDPTIAANLERSYGSSVYYDGVMTLDQIKEAQNYMLNAKGDE